MGSRLERTQKLVEYIRVKRHEAPCMENNEGCFFPHFKGYQWLLESVSSYGTHWVWLGGCTECRI